MFFTILLVVSVVVLYFSLGAMLANDCYLDNWDLLSCSAVFVFWGLMLVVFLIIYIVKPLVNILIPRWYMKERKVGDYIKFFVVRQWVCFCWNKEVFSTKSQAEIRVKELRGV